MEQIPDADLIREAMRRISHRRERTTRTCQQCGAAIPNALPHRRYCSDVCRQRAYRARPRQEPAE